MKVIAAVSQASPSYLLIDELAPLPDITNYGTIYAQ